MNFGLREGFTKVRSPRIATGFNSPTSVWNYRVQISSNITVNSWDFIIASSTLNFTLPAYANIGDQIAVYATASFQEVITAPPRQTINGLSSLTFGAENANGCYIVVQKVTSSAWVCVVLVGTDAELGWNFSATIVVNGISINSSKITSLANGTVSTDAVAFGQLSNGTIQGQILATKQYAPATLDTIALTATLAALDTTNLTLEFTVPASGIVDIDVQAFVLANSASVGAVVGLALLNHTGGAQIGNTINVAGSGQSVLAFEEIVRAKFHLTGLTPGALQVDLAGAASSVSGFNANVYIQGYTGNPVLSQGIPAIIQAVSSV